MAVKFLAFAFRDIISGSHSWLFDQTERRSGDRSTAIQGLNYIAIAVAYAESSKAKLIDDRRYNKTIREAYGVSPKAVRVWIKDSRLRGIAEEFFGKSLENLANSDNCVAQQIADQLSHAGAQYKYSHTSGWYERLQKQ